MTATDRIIRWSTTVAVVGVAVIAAVSYEHAGDLVRPRGEAGWTARLIPLTVDGLIYASSMVMLGAARRGAARRGARVPALARRLLGLGIVATLAANVAHGLGHGLMGAAVAAWPAVALVGSSAARVSVPVLVTGQAPWRKRAFLACLRSRPQARARPDSPRH